MAPSGPTMPSPSSATSALRTSGSVRSRWWTISSLETVAAPWAANESSAALLPAPMPPVMATAIGRRNLRGWGLGLVAGRSVCIRRRLGLELDLGRRVRLGCGLVGELGHGLLGFLRRLRGDVLARLGGRAGRKHVFGEIELRRHVHRLAAVGAR